MCSYCGIYANIVVWTSTIAYYVVTVLYIMSLTIASLNYPTLHFAPLIGHSVAASLYSECLWHRALMVKVNSRALKI